jgi:hypothetical protein
MAEGWKDLDPHRNVFELDSPGRVSGNIAYPKTVIASISRWMSSDKGYQFTSEQISNFNSLPDA